MTEHADIFRQFITQLTSESPNRNELQEEWETITD